MHERPIGDLIDALRGLARKCGLHWQPWLPAADAQPGPVALALIRWRCAAMSSQFLTALLMALPLTGRRVTVQVIGELISKPYIDITLNPMGALA